MQQPIAQSRPVAIPRWGSYAAVLVVLGSFIVILTWLFTVIEWSHMPLQIPHHFTAQGKVNAMGNRSVLILLPAIMTLLFVGLAVLSRFPRVYNYTVTVTKENAAALYGAARLMILVLSVLFAVLMAGMQVMLIERALHPHFPVEAWFIVNMAMLVLLVPGVIVVGIVRMRRLA